MSKVGRWLSSIKRTRYPKYLRYLDGFGVFGLVSVLWYLLCPDRLRPEAHLDGLWGNFSSELIGIWVSVRFIDWVIRSHESSTKARVRVVRNMRFLERMMLGLGEYRRVHDLKWVFRELTWAKGLLSRRNKYLTQDEIVDVERFYAVLDEMVGLLPATADLMGVTFDLADPDGYFRMLEELEKARFQAESNILEETEEDEGM